MKKPASKSELVEMIAKASGLSRAQVSAALAGLVKVAGSQLRSHGIVAIPGLMKMVTVHKAACKAHMGLDPFTKERRMMKARPACNRVKARASKTLLG
jgi:nucleoid DNA-binding protein